MIDDLVNNIIPTSVCQCGEGKATGKTTRKKKYMERLDDIAMNGNHENENALEARIQELHKEIDHYLQLIHDTEGALDGAEKKLNQLLAGLDSDGSYSDGSRSDGSSSDGFCSDGPGNDSSCSDGSRSDGSSSDGFCSDSSGNDSSCSDGSSSDSSCGDSSGSEGSGSDCSGSSVSDGSGSDGEEPPLP